MRTVGKSRLVRFHRVRYNKRNYINRQKKKRSYDDCKRSAVSLPVMTSRRIHIYYDIYYYVYCEGLLLDEEIGPGFKKEKNQNYRKTLSIIVNLLFD